MKIPVPFVGWIEVEDAEDTQAMLRKQLEIQQTEIMRLGMEVADAYRKGWSDAIDAATQRLRKGLEDYDND
jgi:hypothetical protein